MLNIVQTMSNRRWLALLFTLAAAIVISDQLTKKLAEYYLHYGYPVPVTSFFNLTLLYNKGAAWSFLSNAGGWQRWLFTGISAAAVVGISYWLVYLRGKQRLLAFGLALVLGGAAGNLIDRALYGQVVDFLSFHWQHRWYFPAFNIADSAITAGAGVLILDMLKGGNGND